VRSIRRSKSVHSAELADVTEVTSGMCAGERAWRPEREVPMSIIRALDKANLGVGQDPGTSLAGHWMAWPETNLTGFACRR
jgi:hypothetical protein